MINISDIEQYLAYLEWWIDCPRSTGELLPCDTLDTHVSLKQPELEYSTQPGVTEIWTI